MKISKLINKSLAGVLLFNMYLNSNINTLASNEVNIINEDIYELPTLDTWEMNIATNPAPRAYIGVANIDNSIYLISGSGMQGRPYTVQEYNIRTGEFTIKNNIPTPMNNFATATYKNFIYCFGNNIVQVYDTVKDSWETKESMLTPRLGSTAVEVDGKIYVIGGKDGSAYSNKLEVYDIESNTWEAKESMSVARDGLTSVIINNKIYVIGGYNGSEYLNTVEVYDISTNTWKTLESMPTGRAEAGSALVDNKIYVAGGKNGSTLKTVEAYNIETNEWETKAEIPTAKTNLAGCTIGEYVYWVEKNAPNYIHKYRAKWTDEESAINSVNIAEGSINIEDIKNARRLVNNLPESELKDTLQTRLNNIFATSEGGLVEETASSNADIYITMNNALSLSLDTNTITFDDFMGIEDVEKKGAIKLTVESSLPYQIDASLETEIKSQDGTNTLDKSILGIKSSDSEDYESFVAVKTPITLLDSQEYGDVNIHPIDLKLNRGTNYKVDVYKASIKFEVRQK